jgi:hypothetical protein
MFVHRFESRGCSDRQSPAKMIKGVGRVAQTCERERGYGCFPLMQSLFSCFVFFFFGLKKVFNVYIGLMQIKKN